MRYCVMVARQTLTLFVWVQILVPQPKRDLGISGVSSYRGVAQFGRALRSGRRSRRFKSSHLDQTCGEQIAHRRFSFAISFAPAAECLRWRFAFEAGAGNNPIPHRAARNQLIYTSLWKGSARTVFFRAHQLHNRIAAVHHNRLPNDIGRHRTT